MEYMENDYDLQMKVKKMLR